MDFDPPTLIARLITLLIALTLHEYAHAWTAFRFGDLTAMHEGRLTLNPLNHLDPIGTLLLIMAGFGWARPVPINPETIQRNNPAGVMIVSLAGPLTNLLLALAVAIPLRLGIVDIYEPSGAIFPSFGYFLLIFLVVNLSLFFFNLLPLAPLDGEKVLSFFLPKSWLPIYGRLQRYGLIILLILLFVAPRLGFNPVYKLIRALVFAIARFLVNR